MLQCENLSLMRGSNLVVSEVTAALEEGQITAIVGPNGAGKSSLLLGLAGLLSPAAGDVQIDGKSLRSLSPQERARRIGYLPQDGQVAWDVSVESLVALGRHPHRDSARGPVDDAISTMGLDDLRTRPASKLSGGERARALLARVLAGTPDWILADEPLAALDLAYQLSLVKHLRACAQAGNGVVIVLHDLALAMNHADRVFVLREGRLVANGKPEQALSSEVIANVWNTGVEWLGEPGSRGYRVGV